MSMKIEEIAGRHKARALNEIAGTVTVSPGIHQMTIELTRSERELLLNILHIDPTVEKKIVGAPLAQNRFRLELTPAELGGLLNGIASEASHTDDRQMERAYEELQSKLEKTEKGAG
jgi:hypothetical protein